MIDVRMLYGVGFYLLKTWQTKAQIYTYMRKGIVFESVFLPTTQYKEVFNFIPIKCSFTGSQTILKWHTEWLYHDSNISGFE